MNFTKQRKKSFLIIPISLFAIFFFILHERAGQIEAVNIILDTDISSDVDDAGAVAVLHALVNSGEVKILAMMVSSGDPWGAACLDALNTSFGRPDIPVGEIKKPTVTHESKYTRYIAENYSNTITSRAYVPDATALYRNILANSTDKSVTIVSVGYFSNLYQLLISKADKFSKLNGKELVKKKVNRIVCMGGKFPAGREWNIYHDIEAASYVVLQWPTEILFSGYEIGYKVLSGKVLKKIKINHPLKKTYQLYNGLEDRQSWDQIAVLQAAGYGKDWDAYWALSAYGKVEIDHAGNNKWSKTKDGQHRYMIWTEKTEQLSNIIDGLMLSVVQTDNQIVE